jgi:uncharacterized membrane protein
MEYEPLLLQQADADPRSTAATVTTAICAVGCGGVAGLMFTFSVFVMRALGSIPVPAGIAAMQAINVKIITPLFFALFFGTAAFAVAVLALHPDRYSVAAAVIYLTGVISVTIAVNVPLNNDLAAVEASDLASEAAVDVWKKYLSVWTWWNHVRTVSAFSAASLFIVSLVQ